MNRFITGALPLFLILAALMSYRLPRPTFPLYITGHVRPAEGKGTAGLQGLVILAKGDGKLLARSVADGKGDFNMMFTPDKEKRFDFYCTRPGCDTLLVGTFRSFDEDSEEMTFYVPLVMKSTGAGQIQCPDRSKANLIRKKVKNTID